MIPNIFLEDERLYSSVFGLSDLFIMKLSFICP